MLPHDNLLVAGEYPGDPVGFGDECGVDHREGEPRHDPAEGAGEHAGPGQQSQGRQVGYHHANQNDVRELSCRGLQ